MLGFWSASVRRWYVLLACAALTAALYAMVLSRPDVYAGRVDIAVLAPQTVDRSQLQRPDAVLLASMAVMEINDSPHHLVSSSSATTLYGRGVTRGTVLRIEHSGNQWKPDVPRPYIIVEAADGTPEAVQQRLEETAAALEKRIRGIEDEFEVSPSQRVEIVRFSGPTAVSWVPTSPSRAALGSGLVGLFLALWAVPAADRRLSRRRVRRRAQPDPQT